MASVPSRRYDRSVTSFRDFFDEFFNEPFYSMVDRDITGRVWPRVDIVEEKNHFAIRADLPGLRKEDVSVSLEGDTLTISGEKKEDFQSREGAFKHFERTYGSFCRSFTLPEHVDREKIDAKFHDGVLELTLNKTEEHSKKSKRIEVKS